MRYTLTIIAIVFATAAAAREATPSCRGSWNVVGICFPLHGTLTRETRSPNDPRAPRLYIDGASVSVGVLGLSYNAAGANLLPPNVEAQLKQGAVEGDFTLCPLDRDMQRVPIRLVCIEEARNLTPRRRPR